jgi:imidazolonepropionase-like amidohydrolase
MKKIFLLIGVISYTFSFGQQTILHCGQLLTMENEEMQTEMSIVVENNRIKQVVEGYIKGDKIIDLKDKTVLPGLMDMHVHIEHESNPKRYENKFRESDADVALHATVFCKRTLEAGFTLVRDLGGTGVNVALQKAIDRSFIEGPRIITAEKSIASTGGHADPTNGVRKEYKGDPGPAEGVVNSPEEGRKAVRQRYKNGADCIKITATGGVLSVAKDGSGPQFTQEEINAIVETAQDYGMTTAAHAHGKEGMLRAVKGGITSIEHGTMMDEEVMDEMILRGTYYVPTICAGKFVAEKAKIEGFYPKVIVPKALAIGPKIQETFAKAYQRGVKIAFGTDSGVSYHGENAKEFIYMTEVGMPPIEALISATRTPAEMLKLDKDLGTISVGKYADIIAVDDNPLEKIETMLDVSFVMKNGIVYKD